MDNDDVQTDNLSAMCVEFVVEQRGALSDRQCQTELLSATTEHCPVNHTVANSTCKH